MFIACLPVLIGRAQDVPTSVFVTLGTNGGPQGEIDRAQPANALLVDDDIYLVDAGDGAAWQLARIGVRLTRLDGLFLSHLHFDHTGGLLAVLGQRAQLNSLDRLPVYGPPGTKTLVDGLLAGMQPGLNARAGANHRAWQANVDVIEMVDGSRLELDGLVVTAAENSHYRLVEARDGDEKPVSLSFRFDLEDRSVVYTGDTGPSDNVAQLARGADLLVSEVIDVAAMLSRVRRQAPEMSDEALASLERHLRAHHLTPQQVGELAARAQVGSVVLTHVSPSIRGEAQASGIVSGVRQVFDGRVILAEDLDRF